MKRADVVAEARSWLAVPWVHQGRTRSGVDCIGLVVVVGRTFEVPHEDRVDYARVPIGNAMLNHLRRFLTPVSGVLTPDGTVGIFRQSVYGCHVGIFSTINGVPHIIHSRADRKKVVEERFKDGELGMNLLEVLAFPGLEE